MSGVIERLYAAIVALLTTDASFTAELVLALGAGGVGLPSLPTTIVSPRPLDDIRQLGNDVLPCWIVEPINLQAGPIPGLSEDPYGLVISGMHQAFKAEIGVGLVWNNEDRDAAQLQRMRLPDLLTRLFLRIPDAGVAGVQVCCVTDTEGDQGLNHPHQNFKAVLTADLIIERS